MNFCPTCGAARSGNFCAGCGFAFDEASASVKVAVVQNRPQSIIYGDEYDPDNDCFNCGNPKSKRAKSCSLCDQEFEK